MVQVTDKGLSPDPVIVHVNDIVVWAFKTYQSTDLVLIEHDTDLLKYSELASSITPRRHLSYSFKETGVFHFASPSFDTTVDENNKEASKGLDVQLTNLH